MWFSQKRVYLDHAAATPVCRPAQDALRTVEATYANPGAIHAEGVAARTLLEAARAAIAQELGVRSRQVLFVSGSTEGNNLAILGTASQVLAEKGTLRDTHWIVSAIEHPSVLESFAEIERLGGAVSHVDPDTRGIMREETLARALRDDTRLVSIGWANHEIGTVQPLRALSQLVRRRAPRALFHTDMGQAPLFRIPHVHSLGVDMAVLGGGKLYGPHGIAALYLSNNVALARRSFGGGQERGLRAGTEDVARAVGFAAALGYVATRRAAESARIAALRDELARGICARMPDAVINGSLEHALPHLLNVSIPGIQPEYAVLAFDKAGIALSTKSACNAGEAASHVVETLGGEDWRAAHTLRFSLGYGTSARDIHRVLQALPLIVPR